MQLDLYRIKVFRRTLQELLFTKPVVPAVALSRALIEQPTSRPYRGVAWHIGNVERLDVAGVYFRLGRRSKGTVPLLDSKGDFVESELDRAPYTHALADTSMGLCALARNSALAQTTATMARRLITVLEASTVEARGDLTFSVGPVSNPEEFLELLRNAFAIRSFAFTVQRRNPIDANREFIQPFERLVEATEASAGRATIKGPQLSAQPLEDITRSVAATGDDAKARVLMSSGSSPVIRTLRGDTVSVGVDSLESEPEKVEALELVREAHRRVRGSDDR